MKKLYGWIVALILFSFVCTGLFLTIAPDRIPAHYNARGEVDRWGSKYEYLLLPAISLISGGLLPLVGRYEAKKGRGDNEKIVGWLTVWMLIVFNALWIFFMAKAVDPDTAVKGLTGFSAKGICILLMVLLIVLGNQMPKVSRNSALGLRTKWSMADDVCWQKSQRFGGFLIVSTGIVGAAAVSIAPVAWSGYLVIGMVLVMTCAASIGSYRIYRKEHP